MSVQKCASDSSPHVRKTVANALPNLLPRASDQPIDGEADGAEGAPEAPPEVLELLQKLFGDTSPAVLGAASAAFLEIASDRLDLLHPITTPW